MLSMLPFELHPAVDLELRSSIAAQRGNAVGEALRRNERTQRIGLFVGTYWVDCHRDFTETWIVRVLNFKRHYTQPEKKPGLI